MQPKDTLLVTLSDMHSGSNFALFLPRAWHGRKTSHIPRSGQEKIRVRFELFAAEVAQARKGKRVILVHNGDAIDGDHHNSGDVCTTNVQEQADIHVELMNEFQKRIKWAAGDQLYYTRGTQTHVNEVENAIGKEMNALMDGDSYVFDLLRLNINGMSAWYVHHGPRSGDGAGEGNPLRNWLKTIYINALKDGTEIPDIVYTGHVHSPTYAPLSVRLKDFTFKNIHGIILPSWQLKTAYAWQKAPISRNMVGGVMQEVKSDGTIAVPKFSVTASD